jgi:hypothetical protein
VSAQEIRNKIEKKSLLQQEGNDTVSDSFPPYLEEEKIPLNLQVIFSIRNMYI